MQRRTFLASLSSVLAVQTLRSLHIDAQNVSMTKDPFTVGVASGDPASDGVLIWTRLVPDLGLPDFGLPASAIDVRWEVAADQHMKKIVASGHVSATPELNHSVRVDVRGLAPSREYFYRFHAGGATSLVGRTRTAPALDAPVDKFRFAFASCQSYEPGFYTAHRDMAQADVDLVVFLGDYIYEHHNTKIETARRADIADVLTLEQYRHHYAQYKMDPDLIACHQAHPWIVTPDDHEVENNWAGDHSAHGNPEALIARRTAAYQAYYENMPLRELCTPHGSHMQLFRNVQYGRLAQFTVLDTRQFRSPQPCHDKPVVNCAERYEPGRTMMGAEQEQWFMDSLTKSKAHWNVIANQVIFAQGVQATPEGPIYPSDDWDGYVAERQKLTDFMAKTNPRNPFIITGDAHRTNVANILVDYDKKNSPIVASEICGTSITSGADGVMSQPADGRIMDANPHILYRNHKRGYVLCEATEKQMTSTLRIVDKVSVKDGKMSTAASFAVESDRKGIRQLS
jgi:alkaline phosphatase D